MAATIPQNDIRLFSQFQTNPTPRVLVRIIAPSFFQTIPPSMRVHTLLISRQKSQ